MLINKTSFQQIDVLMSFTTVMAATVLPEPPTLILLVKTLSNTISKTQLQGMIM